MAQLYFQQAESSQEQHFLKSEIFCDINVLPVTFD